MLRLERATFLGIAFALLMFFMGPHLPRPTVASTAAADAPETAVETATFTPTAAEVTPGEKQPDCSGASATSEEGTKGSAAECFGNSKCVEDECCATVQDKICCCGQWCHDTPVLDG